MLSGVPSVVRHVRIEHLPGPRLVPGTHQYSDFEDSREAALVRPVQLTLDALTLEQALEDLRLHEVIGRVDRRWLVCVHWQDSLVPIEELATPAPGVVENIHSKPALARVS
jgi:hypothetical protein